MRKLYFVFILALCFSTVFAGSGKKYGKGISLKEKTKVSQILSNPKDYIGKKVLVEGTVLDVCSKRGCWMEISSDKQFQKIKVKVKDGEIVFPMEAKGKSALVEGEVYEINLTKEEALKQAEHEAEEHGKKFDPSSIKGPVTYYQLKGIGAEIK
jgi:gamma-glutamylcyclotransferase (GGCT)/AIG2-like uncharacterized protein YtfP